MQRSEGKLLQIKMTESFSFNMRKIYPQIWKNINDTLLSVQFVFDLKKPDMRENKK